MSGQTTAPPRPGPRRWIAAGAGLLLLAALLGPGLYTGRKAVHEAEALAAGKPYCWMQPGAGAQADRLVLSEAATTPYRFWRSLLSRPPGLPVFGMILAAEDGRENPESFWGWSHRRGTFYPLREQAAALAITGFPAACEEISASR